MALERGRRMLTLLLEDTVATYYRLGMMTPDAVEVVAEARAVLLAGQGQRAAIASFLEGQSKIYGEISQKDALPFPDAATRASGAANVLATLARMIREGREKDAAQSADDTGGDDR